MNCQILSFLSVLLYCSPLTCEEVGGDTDKVTDGDEPEPNTKPPPPYALSYVYIRHLAKVEEELYKLMQNYETVLKSRLKIVSNYVKDYEDSSVRGTRQVPDNNDDPLVKAEVIASHPLMSYRLIRRFASEIEALGQDLSLDVEKQLRKSVTGMMEGQPWPTKSDHESAMDALLRLQYVYDLDLKELSTGKIAGIHTEVGLTAKQSFHIAKFASYAEFHSLALDWLGVTSWKMVNTTEEGRHEVGANTLALAYRHTVEKHNAEFDKIISSGNLYTFDQKITGSGLPLRTREKELEALMKKPIESEDIDELSDTEQAQRAHYAYVSLCNGIRTKPPSFHSQLYCYQERSKNPYWYINPLKVEVLSVNPWLIQMYEFIGQKWIDYLIQKATPISMAPPTPGPYATPRTAAYAWLNDSEIPDAQLSRRIEFITGLNVIGEEASTALQIASYVFGGHVANHVDSLGEDSDDRGDRATTFLIYLNDVTSGGYTAYPLLDTFVIPVKGSAILWYDSLKNGDIDHRMLHGACPPKYGFKWIATKWTHVNENMFTRKCDLDPDE